MRQPNRARQSGALNPNWKGGRTIATNGYVLVKAPTHPRADSRGYVLEHIIVAERKIGRALLPGEEVHHENACRTDNRPENLIVKASRSDHALAHRKRDDLRLPDEPNPLVACLCGCGAEFPRFDGAGRPRRYLSGHNSGLLPPSLPCECGCGELAAPGKRFVLFHRKRRVSPVVPCSCGCGATFPQFDQHGRERRFVPGHNARTKGARGE